MKLLALLIFFIASMAVHAQSEIVNGELYIRDAWSNSKSVNLKMGGASNLKKVAIGSEKDDGSIEILSDLIVHQDLKLYVVNPLNGKVSRVDLDEKSEYYGSVNVVSGLVVQHSDKFYLVNPLNGKTNRIRE